MSEQHPELPSASVSVHPRASSSPRWRAIWLLAAASLLPGVVSVLAREFFHGLPYPVRIGVYVLSGLLMAAVVALILTQKETA